VAGEKILVIDDNLENIRFMVDYLLVPSGYIPIVATDGNQGLDMALSQQPDLIILDFKLPAMSGLEVLRALRENASDIPVIFMTAYGSEEDIVTCFRLGIKDYFSKPFEVQDMLGTIERVLGEKRQQEQQKLRQRELQECVKELATLYGSSMERVLNRIVESAVAITDAEEGYLLLVDKDTDELYMRSALNLGERFARGFRLKINDSITGQVVRTGRPVRYNYLDDFDRFKVKTGYLVKSLLNIPLQADGKVIGVLGVDNKNVSKTFSRTDQELLISLAEHAVTAIENASVYEQTHQALIRQVQELSAIQDLARDLNGIMDLSRIASLVLHYAMAMTTAEAGLVGLREQSNVRWISRGYITTAMESGAWQPDWDRGMIGRATHTGSCQLLDGTVGDPEDEGGLPQTRSHLVIPVLHGDHVLGIIDLEDTRLGVFTEGTQRLLLALADQVAAAVENTRLFDMVVGEQSKTRFILSSIADGVYTVDRDLCILTFNPAAERITGWHESEVRGKPCSEFFRDVGDEHTSHQAMLIQRVLADGEPVSSAPDVPAIYRRDGREVFISSSVAPLRNRESHLVGVVVAFRDVSVEREFDRLKSDFVSMVSHELRSPLASLSAAIELMLGITPEQESVRQTLEIARTNALRLNYLIEDILNVSQIEAGQMKVHLEPLTLLPTVRRAIRIAQSHSDKHHIALKASEVVPFVMADQSKLEIVLNNLLINAVNYSPNGGRILVRIADAGTDELVVSVIDEGIGIAEEHIGKLFERFYRIDTSDRRRVYGHGLGLYISKRLVELQGGRIWVESKVEKGSCFSFTIPIVQESGIAQEEYLTTPLEN
jgi:PAS domain S-box-containing protein